jgi:hypothetical protein
MSGPTTVRDGTGSGWTTYVCSPGTRSAMRLVVRILTSGAERSSATAQTNS